MGSNSSKNNKQSAPPQVATEGLSGSDPRGRSQNMNAYQQERFEGQQTPIFNTAMGGYNQAVQQGQQDYSGIMGQYQNMMGPGGYGEFAKTGGFSDADKANIRARGISPIRAAYSNAEREVGRQRSLQGGYSPNATATLAKMAREQGQAGADASTNVEAELASRVNQGRLAGMAGQMGAIQGQSGLYGTTPGMANMFGNQAMNAMNSGAQFGGQMMNSEQNAQQLPGAFDNTMGKIKDVVDIGGRVLNPIMEKVSANKKQKAGFNVSNTGRNG